MILASIYDADGRIGLVGRMQPYEAPLNTPEGGGWIEGRYDGAVSYVGDGAVAPRPVTGLPEAHGLPTDTDWTLPDVPSGTQVLIEGAEAGVTDAEGLVLTFPEARLWHVELRPPFPWRAAECEVTVT